MFFETNSLDDIGTTYDVALERKIAATSIGHHPNDRSVSFYFRNPSRWFIEYGWQLRTVDPHNFPTEQYVLKPGRAGTCGAQESGGIAFPVEKMRAIAPRVEPRSALVVRQNRRVELKSIHVAL